MSDEAVTERMVFLRGKSSADRFVCSSLARTFGLRAGLSTRAAEELAIAAAELGSNVARHAEEGLLILRYVAAPRPHVLMECRDRGPGIADVNAVKADGFSGGKKLEPDASRSEGIGCGFGSIGRLVDEYSIESVLSVGTFITAKKWVR